MIRANTVGYVVLYDGQMVQAAHRSLHMLELVQYRILRLCTTIYGNMRSSEGRNDKAGQMVQAAHRSLQVLELVQRQPQEEAGCGD